MTVDYTVSFGAFSSFWSDLGGPSLRHSQISELERQQNLTDRTLTEQEIVDGNLVDFWTIISVEQSSVVMTFSHVFL